MKKFVIVKFVIIIGLFSLFGCNTPPSEGFSIVNSNVEYGEKDYEKIISDHQSIAFQLFQRVEDDEAENLLLSPFSFITALSMLYNGADEQTKAEISSILANHELDREEVNRANASLLMKLFKDTDEITFHIGNSLWLNEAYEVQQDFTEQLKNYYGAEIEKVDHEKPKSVQKINKWVERATNKKIPEIIDSLDPNFVAMLINTIYFQGKWTYPMNPNDTTMGTFHSMNQNSNQIPFMHLHEELPYLENDRFQAVKLPYGKEEAMSMVIFLPDDRSSVHELIEELTMENWKEWKTKFQIREGILKLPKFQITDELSLKGALMELGIRTAFDPQEANFSKMIQGNEQIFVSEIKQKTFLEVDEEGTEAAAATAIEIRVTSAPLEHPFEMNIDRPFVFMIQDEETGAILLIGKIANL